MKKVLVFGGFGFLGFYLVKELLKRGFKVTVADVTSNNELIGFVKYYKCDISKESEIVHVFEENTFDVVFNLAGFANLDQAIKNPIKTISLNVLNNMTILEQCLKHKIKRFVYASSAYAMSNKGSFYGISKLASEKIIEEYHDKYGLDFTILRYGSVYSEKDYDNNYIYNVIKQAVLEKKIMHNGDGKEIREYIHAADAAKLSVDILESDSFKNLHIILTGNERMRREELFNMIKEILNDSVDIKCVNEGYSNHYKFTPYSFEPSVSKRLTANPHIDMGQGILECIRAVYNNEKNKL